MCRKNKAAINFTVPGADIALDLNGDPSNPDLIIFFGGNQFMVLPELIKAFKKEFTAYKSIFYETLPPGIVEQQLKNGGLITGGLKITLQPDLFVAGLQRLKRLSQEGLILKFKPYYKNNLVILVREGNPLGLKGLKSLAGAGIRISMPDPETEGIAEQVKEALIKTGGEDLEKTVMERKVEAGETVFTQIHHRQTPQWLMSGKVDCALVWRTEALFQKRVGNPLDYIEIARRHNVTENGTAGIVRKTRHLPAAADFFEFLSSPLSCEIYKEYGFQPA